MPTKDLQLKCHMSGINNVPHKIVTSLVRPTKTEQNYAQFFLIYKGEEAKL